MSIELNRARVGAAIVACECAQAALSKAIRLNEEALLNLSAELKFGNDPATEEGAKLAKFGDEVDWFMRSLLNADLFTPHCDEAMAALSRIAAVPAPEAPTERAEPMRSTGAATINLARAIA